MAGWYGAGSVRLLIVTRAGVPSAVAALAVPSLQAAFCTPPPPLVHGMSRFVTFVTLWPLSDRSVKTEL